MSQDPAAPKGASRTVGGVMVTRPKALPCGTTVAQARDAFDNDHVHMLLLTEQGVLRGTLVRADLDAAHDRSETDPALPFSQLRGRTVAPHDCEARVLDQLIDEGSRRLAVVDDDGQLLGLLCLKRRLNGFCSDLDIAARAADPRS